MEHKSGPCVTFSIFVFGFYFILCLLIYIYNKITCGSMRLIGRHLAKNADDNLFNSILYNNEHVLNRILPTKTEST